MKDKREEFDRLYSAFVSLGFIDEWDLNRQYAPTKNHIACWWTEDGEEHQIAAIILGLGDNKYVDFVFDKDFKLTEVRTDNSGCRYTEPA